MKRKDLFDYKKKRKSLFKGFLSLEKVLDKFVKKNNFSKPKSITETSRGKIITWSDTSQVILYDKLIEDGSTHYFYIGGSGCYAQAVKGYYLEGILEGKEVKLEAEISKAYHPSRKTRLQKSRKDEFDYWFITKSK